MTVFIICVGTRDPLWNRERSYDPKEEDFDLERYDKGPIISYFETLLQEREEIFHRPVRIYLLGTTETPMTVGETTYKRSERVAEFLKEYSLKNHPDYRIFCLPLRVANPANSEELYPQIRDNLEVIKSEAEKEASKRGMGGKVRYIINPQPGTPQMSYVLIALSVAGFFKPEPQFLESIHPGYQEVGGSGLMEDNISMISQSAVLKRAQSLFRRCHFQPAAEAFEDLFGRMYDQEAERRVEVLIQLSKGYSDWDACQYKEAHKCILGLLESQDVRSNNKFVKLRSILERQDEFLVRGLVRDTSIRHRAVDWYYAAQRRSRQRSYSDIIWRCAHIDEMIAVAKALEAIHGIYGVRLSADKFGVEVMRNKSVRTGLYPGSDPPNKLHRIDAYNTIDKLKRASGVVYLPDPVRDQADEVYSIRNDMLHNGYIPGQSDAKRALNVAGLIIRAVYGTGALRDFPFDNNIIINIADDIIPSLIIGRG